MINLLVSVRESTTYVPGATPTEARVSDQYLYLVLDVQYNAGEAFFLVTNDDGHARYVSSRHFVIEEVLRDGKPLFAKIPR